MFLMRTGYGSLQNAVTKTGHGEDESREPRVSRNTPRPRCPPRTRPSTAVIRDSRTVLISYNLQNPQMDNDTLYFFYII